MEVPAWLAKKRADTVNAIKKHNKKIWMPPEEIEWQDVESGTIVSIKKSDDHQESLDAPVKCKARKDQFIRSRTVTLYPTVHQRKILRDWGERSRMMYNYTRRLLNAMIDPNDTAPKITDPKMCPNISMYDIRAKLKKKATRLAAKSSVLLDKASCRMQTLDLILAAACSNYKTCQTSLARKKIRSFTMPPIPADHTSRCIRLAGRIFDKRGFYATAIGKMKATREVGGVHKRYKFYEGMRDSVLIIDLEADTYTLYVPQPNEAPEMTLDRHRFIAIDPGYRTLLTGISESHALAIGDGIMDLTDTYIEKLAQLKLIKKKRERLKKISRIKQKFHDRIDAMHWKVASYLTKNYDNVLIGDMSPVKIISRRGTLYSSYKEKMVLIRYGKFRERLEQKCHQRSVGFKIVDESFTSRACSACGFVKDKDSSKTHRCPSCPFVTDRDINGARNIYCKHL